MSSSHTEGSADTDSPYVVAAVAVYVTLVEISFQMMELSPVHLSD